MVVGYRFFLRRMATIMDSKENLTIRTIANRLNLRHDEFRDLLNIMVNKGDIKCVTEGAINCAGNCTACSKLCAGPELSARNDKIKSYSLTEKGRAICEGLS